jgi:biotin transport system permease protein
MQTDTLIDTLVADLNPVRPRSRPREAVLLGGLVLVFGLYAIARIPPAAIAGQLRGPLMLLAVLFLAHGLLTGWLVGLVVVLRFAVLILLATLVALTTPVSEMLETFERVLRPTAVLGIDPERIAFVLAMTIRLIPMLAAFAQEVHEAQRARGLDRNLVALTVPLLIRCLRAADALGEAIEARGGLGERRPRR